MANRVILHLKGYNCNLYAVTCIIISNCCHFSQLVLSTHPLLFYQLKSPYQTFAIFSPLVIYSLFYVTYAPYKCNCCTHSTTQLSLPSYRARALCANTPFQLNRRLWPTCHFDFGGTRHGWGFSPTTTMYVMNTNRQPLKTAVLGFRPEKANFFPYV